MQRLHPKCEICRRAIRQCPFYRFPYSAQPRSHWHLDFPARQSASGVEWQRKCCKTLAASAVALPTASISMGCFPSAATAHTFRMRAYAALSAGGSFFWIPSRCWISCQKETNYGISISGHQRPGSFLAELWHDDARRRRTLCRDGQCAGGRGAPPHRNLRRGGGGSRSEEDTAGLPPPLY